MSLFKIYQKLPFDEIEDEYLDCDEIVLGVVDDEYFAQEFCEQHPDCYYGELFITKYSNQLAGRMVSDNTDCELLKIAVKKYD